MKNVKSLSINTQRLIAAVMNILVVLFEATATVNDFVTHNNNTFVFYTNDSNYFAGLVCLLCAIFELRAMHISHTSNGSGAKGQQDIIPYAVKVIKFVATCCLMLTFTVVLTILVPAWSSTGVNGFKMMFGPYQMFARHLVCPVLVFVSFVFFEKKPLLEKKTILFGEIPTLLYAAVTIVLNIFRIIDGPYPFLRVHSQSVCMSFAWGVIVLGISLLLSWITWLFNRCEQ